MELCLSCTKPSMHRTGKKSPLQLQMSWHLSGPTVQGHWQAGNKVRHEFHHNVFGYYRADSRFAPSQWEMVLLCNAVSYWLGANLGSALYYLFQKYFHSSDINQYDQWNFISYHSTRRVLILIVLRLAILSELSQNHGCWCPGSCVARSSADMVLTMEG